MARSSSAVLNLRSVLEHTLVRAERSSSQPSLFLFLQEAKRSQLEARLTINCSVLWPFKEGEWVVRSEIALSSASLLPLSSSRVELRQDDNAVLGCTFDGCIVRTIKMCNIKHKVLTKRETYKFALSKECKLEKGKTSVVKQSNTSIGFQSNTK